MLVQINRSCLFGLLPNLESPFADGCAGFSATFTTSTGGVTFLVGPFSLAFLASVYRFSKDTQSASDLFKARLICLLEIMAS